jgi:hypothetical protein
MANVVAAATPLRGGEAAYNVSLPYQADALNIPLSELTARLLKDQPTPRLPDALLRELANYPDWRADSRPGAALAPGLLRTLESR